MISSSSRWILFSPLPLLTFSSRANLYLKIFHKEIILADNSPSTDYKRINISKLMDDDLWGPSYNQVLQEDDYYMLPGWQSDFYFGYGFDMTEENVLHEKSCVQVLRMLLMKADAEIDELEKDLVSLQNELAWAEYEDWSEVCYNALRKKMDCLDISIQTLRNKDENDVEIHLLMHTEPPERLHELVKALLKNYYIQKEEQLANTNGKDPSLKSAAGHSDEKKVSNLKSTRKEEVKEPGFTANDKEMFGSLPLRSTQKRRHEPKYQIQHAETRELSSTDASKHLIGHHDSNKHATSESKNIREEVEESSSSSTTDFTILHSPKKAIGENLKDGREEITPMPQFKEKVKPQAEVVQRAENAANDNKLILISYLKSPTQKANRNLGLSPASIPRLGFLSAEDASNSSSNSKRKRQVKPGNKASLNNCLERKVKEKLFQRTWCESEEYSVDMDDSPNTAKKRKKSMPIALKIGDSTVKMEFTEADGDPMKSGSQNDLLIKESCSPDDPGTEAVASSNSAASYLKDLKMCDLRAIAKEQKMTNYYRLKKTDLVERITSRLGCC